MKQLTEVNKSHSINFRNGGLSDSKTNCFNWFNKSPLKMMKNAFCFFLKALFFLKMLGFLSWLFGWVEKTSWLERQD